MVYPDFKVCVRCFTFNQAKYIEETMNGFTMQQTNFPFVCCIVDDASTDGEQEVILKYLEKYFKINDNSLSTVRETDYARIIYSQHNNNVNCYFAVLLLKENLYSKNESNKKNNYISCWSEQCKYEAICEGDDYWIKAEKLQKQVDFLDEHPDFTLCFHNAIIQYEQNEKLPHLFNQILESKEINIKEIVNNWIIPTASILVRRSILPLPKWKDEIYSGDQTLALWSIYKGKVFSFNDIMSVYRRNFCSDSASSFLLKKPSDFSAKEHIKLYEYFQKETNGCFSDVICPHLDYLKKEVKLINYRNHFGLLTFFLMPLFIIRKILMKMNL